MHVTWGGGYMPGVVGLSQAVLNVYFLGSLAAEGCDDVREPSSADDMCQLLFIHEVLRRAPTAIEEHIPRSAAVAAAIKALTQVQAL
jgi:hypothetical protein